MFYPSLPTATLVIYILLAVPILYILICHIPVGLHGWLFLLIFCLLRIVGAALERILSQFMAASIISSVGIALLLLATAGILQEARIYRSTALHKGREWAVFIGFHIVVCLGICMVGVVVSFIYDGSYSSDLAVLHAGIGLITAAWVLLGVWALCSMHTTMGAMARRTHRHGTVLLYSVFVALPFIGIHVLYSLVYLTTLKPKLNPLYGWLVIRAILGFLSEALAVITFIVAGIMTRDVAGMGTLKLNF